jgi:hypothetical protein
MGPDRRSALAALLPALLLGVACKAGGGGETCADCVDEKCSDLAAICAVDPDCACMVDCLGVEAIPGVEGCLATCGLAERPADFVPVEECVAVACPDTGDECSTPSGYEPPELPRSDDTSALVAHGGGGDRADCGFDPELAYTPYGATLQLQSLDGSVCVRLVRHNEGTGALANVGWTLLELRAGPLGGVALVDAPADLCWYASHHNLFDWAHAWTGAVRYDLSLEDEHGGEWSYTLVPYEQGPVDPAACSATTDGTTPIGGPIALYPYAP